MAASQAVYVDLDLKNNSLLGVRDAVDPAAAPNLAQVEALITDGGWTAAAATLAAGAGLVSAGKVLNVTAAPMSGISVGDDGVGVNLGAGLSHGPVDGGTTVNLGVGLGFGGVNDDSFGVVPTAAGGLEVGATGVGVKDGGILDIHVGSDAGILQGKIEGRINGNTRLDQDITAIVNAGAATEANKADKATQVLGGAGLTAGGALDADVTLSVDFGAGVIPDPDTNSVTVNLGVGLGFGTDVGVDDDKFGVIPDPDGGLQVGAAGVGIKDGGVTDLMLGAKLGALTDVKYSVTEDAAVGDVVMKDATGWVAGKLVPAAAGDIEGSLTAGLTIKSGVIVDGDISSDAGILQGKVEGTLTGNTRLNEDIADLDTSMVKLTGNQTIAGVKTFSGSLLVPLSPTANAAAASKEYVDQRSAGMDVHASVLVATSAPILLDGSVSVVDGVTVADGDFVLVKDQSDLTENGVYTVVSGGPWTRRAEEGTEGSLQPGSMVYATSGANDAETVFACSIEADAIPWTPGTDANVWFVFTTNTAVTAGDGILVTGNVVSVGKGNGIALAADSVSVEADPDGGLEVKGTGVGIKTGGVTDLMLGAKLGALTDVKYSVSQPGVTDGFVLTYTTADGWSAAAVPASPLAGAGLTLDGTTGYAVGAAAGAGITVNADDVAVKVDSVDNSIEVTSTVTTGGVRVKALGVTTGHIADGAITDAKVATLAGILQGKVEGRLSENNTLDKDIDALVAADAALDVRVDALELKHPPVATVTGWTLAGDVYTATVVPGPAGGVPVARVDGCVATLGICESVAGQYTVTSNFAFTTEVVTLHFG